MATATVTPLRRSTDHPTDTLHHDLRQMAIDAMLGYRGGVPHVEHRVGGDVVATCPVQEVVAEAMHLQVIGAALMRTLRYSRCPEVTSLRFAIAESYAAAQAPQIERLGGVR